MNLIHQNNIAAKSARKAKLVVIHVYREVIHARRVRAVRAMDKSSSNPLQICEKWELFNSKSDISECPISFWRELENFSVSKYRHFSNQKFGSGLLSLNQLEQILLGKKPLNELSLYLILFETLWVPDLFYSYLCRDAIKGWRCMPESGSDYTGKQTAHIRWKQLWDYPTSERKHRAKQILGPYISIIKNLKPLIDIGAIRFFPWEQFISKNKEGFKDTILGLSSNKSFTDSLMKIDQDQYNLGVRLGPIGIVSEKGDPSTNLKPGAKLHFVDKRLEISNGIAHSIFSAELGASYVPDLPGDRLVYNYIVSNGDTNPKVQPLVEKFNLPNLNNATWEDIVAIRKDSELLSILRSILKEAVFYEEETLNQELKERLKILEEKLDNDSGIIRSSKNEIRNLYTGTLAGATTGALSGGSAILTGAVVGAGIPFTYQLLLKIFGPDAKEKRRRRDLVVRIQNRV